MATDDGLPHQYSGYVEHLSREQINGVLHHAHIIPVSKGYTREYVALHHPGWSFNELIGIFTAAGIIVEDGMPRCDESVKCLHFNDATSFTVEREQG